MRPIIYFSLAAICMLVPIVIGASDAGAILDGLATSDSGGSSNQSLIVTVRPNDYGQMVEMPEFSEGASSVEGAGGFNALWVVDDTGEMNDSLSVPLDSYARVFITPIQGGNVVVEQLDPNDQPRTDNIGTVEPFHTYGIWFYGDKPGTYQMRYNVNDGEYSNVVEFYVS
jgi:hypothetical protein